MHKQFGIVGLVFAGLVPTLALGAAAGAHGTGSSTIPFADARLKIEYNATDGDAGLQVLLDAPPWTELSISNPFGRKVLEVEAEEVIRNYGLTELSPRAASRLSRSSPSASSSGCFRAASTPFAG